MWYFKYLLVDERWQPQSQSQDPSRVIMKAEKGNYFAVLERTDYDEKMESLLSNRSTYQLDKKSLFTKVERELNNRLLVPKKQNKINDSTYHKLRSTDAAFPAIHGSIKHHKTGYPLCPTAA